MRILLDTCTFLWLNLEEHELSARAREILSSGICDLFLSVVSSWEIAVKYSSGRLNLPVPPAVYVPARRELSGIQSLSLEEEAVLQEPKLPRLHGDPFDRMLICQAIIHGLTIMTPDDAISSYPIPTIW